MDYDAGVERIIQAFENGWQAGASFGRVQLDQFPAAEKGLQSYWLDGFYAAQASIGDDGLSSDVEDDAGLTERRRSRYPTASRRLSHPITRALWAAYASTGQAPDHESLAAMLSRLG